MTFLHDLRGEFRWLACGFFLMFFSGFGQTYYVALFAGVLKSELTLSDGAFGGLYAVATLVSAVLLTVCGRLADVVSIRWLSIAVMLGLALTAVLVAGAGSAWVLGLALLGLRFFGQGMLTLTAMTAMGRWFNHKRGRAVAIAGIGMPTGQAVLPVAAVAMMTAWGWRTSWLVAAALLAIVGVPLFFTLLRHERHPTRGPRNSEQDAEAQPQRQWTRPEVLRHGLFYAIMPAYLATPFILTAVFFNQVELVELRGWQLETFARTFTVLAVVNVAAALLAGWAVDRWGARRLLATYLLAMGAGTLLLAASGTHLALLLVMTCYGITMGFAAATSGALWPELYGTRHLGAIRSVVTAVVVVASAVSPGMAGWLLDQGVGLELQLNVMGTFSLLAAAWVIVLIPRMNRVATAPG